jgi:alpha-L-rhamnosidase
LSTGVFRVLVFLLASMVLLFPDAAAAVAQSTSATADPLACDGWASNVVGPADRPLKPVAARWWNGEPLGDLELSRLQETDNAGVRLTQPGQSLVLDFGEVVSGKIEVDVLDASGAAVQFSTTESLAFLAVGSDTRAYGNGDLVYRPGGGTEHWHAFTRRTFRYLLVSLAEPGWVELDRVGLYFTAALGPPTAFEGWFHSSDPLLDSIWYHGAYTLQLVSAAGSSSALDGVQEVWRGQLEMASALESRLLLTAPGADWRDYTAEFDLTIPPDSAGGGWAIRATPDEFVGFRLVAPNGVEPSALQVWQGTHRGAAAFEASHPLPFEVQRGRPYHVRVDVEGDRAEVSVDGSVVSTESTFGLASGRVGLWSRAGDQFDVAHPRVTSADGTLLFEDNFDDGVYLDPARWQNAPQPLLLDGAKRDRAMAAGDLAIAARGEYASLGQWEWIGRLLSRLGEHQFADGKLPGGLAGDDAASPEDDRLPDYTFWWILAVGDYVQQSGDLRTAEALFPRVQAALEWAERRMLADGLMPKGPGEDWYWSANRGSGPTTSLNALYAGSLRAAATLADVLHQDDARVDYLRRAAAVGDAVNAALWDPSVGAYVDGDLRDHHPLDANALAVLFGVAKDERATQALDFLRNRLWTPSGTLAADKSYGGWAQDDAIWPAYIYPEVEARFGAHDDTAALELVRRTWGAMLAHDPSSTFWEFAKADGAVRDGSASLAHGWSTGALPALSRWVLGVRPVTPGYAEYVIDPHPGDLSWACGAVPTPAGPIRIAWQRSDGAFSLQFDAPSGTSGRFIVPVGTPTEVLLDGQPVSTAQIDDSAIGLAGLEAGPHEIQVAWESG